MPRRRPQAGRVKLPVDDLVAPPLDVLAPSAAPRPDAATGASRSTTTSSNGRVVFQRRQELERHAGKLPAALLDQGGNVVRHVLAGVEKIGHAARSAARRAADSSATWSGMFGRAMEKNAGSTFSAPSRAAIRPTRATNRSLASARGLP